MMARGIDVAVLCCLPLLATSFAEAQIDRTIAPGPPARRPNILFLMADDWSSPYAGVPGDPVVKTSRCSTAWRTRGCCFRMPSYSSPSCTAGAVWARQPAGQWH